MELMRAFLVGLLIAVSGCASGFGSLPSPGTTGALQKISSESRGKPAYVEPIGGDPSSPDNDDSFSIGGVTGYLIGGVITGICDPLTGQIIGSSAGQVIPCLPPESATCSSCEYEPTQIGSIPVDLSTITTAAGVCAELGEQFDPSYSECFSTGGAGLPPIRWGSTTLVYGVCAKNGNTYSYDYGLGSWVLNCTMPSPYFGSSNFIYSAAYFGFNAKDVVISFTPVPLSQNGYWKPGQNFSVGYQTPLYPGFSNLQVRILASGAMVPNPPGGIASGGGLAVTASP